MHHSQNVRKQGSPIVKFRAEKRKKENEKQKDATGQKNAEKHVTGQNAALKNTEKEKHSADKNNIIYYKMPCTACGKSGLSVNVTKPKSMILGVQNITRRTVRTVQRPRVLISNQSTGKRAFILGR